jgi:hypothetical protein
MSITGPRWAERRRWAWLGLWAALLVAPGAHAQEDADDLRATKTLTLEFGGLVFGSGLGVEYQSAPLTWLSFYVEPSVLLGWAHGAFNTALDGLWGGELQAGPRFFLWGEAPAGLYLGPLGMAAFLAGTRDGAPLHGWRWGGGAMLGFNWIPFELFDFSVGAGALYQVDEVSGAPAERTQAVIPLVRIGAGMVF